MTGICAGDKKNVNCGDLIVATSAIAYDTGKIVTGPDGKPQLLHELHTWNASLNTLQFALLFQEWQSAVKAITLPTMKDQTQVDGQLPKVHFTSVASGYTVRGDNPFENIRQLVRNALALDMEAIAFYRTVAEFPGTSALLVKGVSDYADGEKDDSYHDYASAASAAYIITFIQAYLNSDRFPLAHI